MELCRCVVSLWSRLLSHSVSLWEKMGPVFVEPVLVESSWNCFGLSALRCRWRPRRPPRDSVRRSEQFLGDPIDYIRYEY